MLQKGGWLFLSIKSGPYRAFRGRRWRGLGVRVLALSAYRYEHYVRGMLEAGAVGYLLKEEAPEAIVEAIRSAARGGMYFSPGIADVVRAIREGKSVKIYRCDL